MFETVRQWAAKMTTSELVAACATLSTRENLALKGRGREGIIEMWMACDMEIKARQEAAREVAMSETNTVYGADGTKVGTVVRDGSEWAAYNLSDHEVNRVACGADDHESFARCCRALQA